MSRLPVRSRRIDPAPPATEARAVAAEAQILASRGTITPLYAVLLHSPAVAAGWEVLLTAIRQKAALPARLRELVILRVAVLNRAPYEFDAHVAHARLAGMSETEIAGLRAPHPRGFDKKERAVLAYTDAMTQSVQVPDKVFAGVQSMFSPSDLVELTATVAAYNMVSRFLAALDVR